MLRIRNYFIAFAVVFAISSAYALIGVQDAKAEEGAAYTDLIKRIEALESNGGGNVTAPKIRGIKMGFEIRHRFELKRSFATGATTGSQQTNYATGRRELTYAGFLANSASAGNSSRGVAETHEFTLQRTRIYLDADVSKNVRGYVKLQDVRTWGAEQSTVGNLSRVDLLEGYVELRNLGDLSSILTNVDIKIGRWQQWYGNHRLIGHLNWANEARSYDGIKFRWDDKKGNWVDAFLYSIEEDSTGGVSGEGAATIPAPSRRADRDELFWGVYAHFTPTEGIATEPYLIIRNRSRDTTDSALNAAVPALVAPFPANAAGVDRINSLYGAGEQRYTAGLRIAGKKVPWLPGVDFTFEQAWQFGELEPGGLSGGGFGGGVQANASQKIQAFAGAWGGGYTFSNLPWSPRIGYDFVFASGDERPGFGKSGSSAKTFSQLYPTGHARLGYMDYHGWQNIKDHQIHFTVKPTKKLLVKVDVHFFEADEEADAWYSVGGTVVRPGGDVVSNDGGVTYTNVDDEYGQEVDVTAKYKLFKNFGVVAGYSHYFTGDFIKDTNNGQDRGADWFYFQTTMKF